MVNPIKKTVIAENLIDTKIALGPGMNIIANRTQIRFEFLKDQKYRLYFHCPNVSNPVYQKLKYNLYHHKTVYTPSLGLSENIANFKFEGEFELNTSTSTNGYILIDSVLPLRKVSNKDGVMFEREGEYFSIRMPIELNTERIVTKYGDIIFDRNCKPMKVKLIEDFRAIEYADGRRENIVFIE